MNPTIPPPLLEWLGRIIVTWSYIEMLSGNYLAHLMRAEIGAFQVVAHGVSHATIVNWIRTIAEIGYNETPAKTAILELLTETDALRAERNSLVHGQWMPHAEPGTATVQTANLERRRIVNTEFVTGASLEHLREIISDCLADWQNLCAAVGA